MKTSDIKGIIPPVITPMNNDPEQTVNHQALREQVERLLAGGVHGIFPMGTNGEAYALSFQEKEGDPCHCHRSGKGPRTGLRRHRLHHHRRNHPPEQACRGAGRRCTVHHHPQLCTGLPEGAV